jgi:HAD superfamily hydrolase (TIGR01549 family)
MLDASAVEAFLFDLDGTLLDSDDQAVEALARGLARLRLREPARAARRAVMVMETPGNAVITALDALGLDAHLDRLTNGLRRLRGQRAPVDFQMVPGTGRALWRLSGRYRLAVVTTRGRADAEAFLERFELKALFQVVVARDSTFRLKPHPAPVVHAARLLALPPGRCAMVGDTTVDVRAARRAGAWAVGVLCGFGEREELERAGAHLVLPSPADLPAAIGLAG